MDSRGDVHRDRREYIQGLRDLADFLSDNEEIPIPTQTRFDIFVYSKESFIQMARKLGYVQKKYSDNFLSLQKSFGVITLELSVFRNMVCRRKVVGKRIVPATPAYEQEIIEWECDESLLKPNNGKEEENDQARVRTGDNEVAAGSDDLESSVFPVTARTEESE